MKEKNHISIYGCCVSRDGFSQHQEDGGYVIDKYIQAVSPFLALKLKKEKDEAFAGTVNRLDGLSNFYKKMLRLEYSGKIFDYLKESKSDWLVLDNGPFRYELYATDAYHLDDGMTNSILIQVKDNFARQIQGTELEELVHRSKTDPLTWDDTVFTEYTRTFLKTLLRQYRQKKIILVRVENVFSHISRDQIITSRVHLEENKKENARMQKAWEIMRAMLPKAHVIELPITVAGNLHHKWGISGLHYVDGYYDYFLKAIDIITQERLPLKKEREKLRELKEQYTKRLWNEYQRPVKAVAEKCCQVENLKNRWEIYTHFSEELLAAEDYKQAFLTFMQRHNYKSCAVYSTCYPIRYLLEAFAGKIKIDYIIENNRKVYEGIDCRGRDQLPYPDTDVILIADMLLEGQIREKFRKKGVEIPCYGMYELLQHEGD